MKITITFDKQDSRLLLDRLTQAQRTGAERKFLTLPNLIRYCVDKTLTGSGFDLDAALNHMQVHGVPMGRPEGRGHGEARE